MCIYKDDKTDCSNYRGIFVKYIQNFFQHPAVKVSFIVNGNFGDHQCGF